MLCHLLLAINMGNSGQVVKSFSMGCCEKTHIKYIGQSGSHNIFCSALLSEDIFYEKESLMVKWYKKKNGLNNERFL